MSRKQQPSDYSRGAADARKRSQELRAKSQEMIHRGRELRAEGDAARDRAREAAAGHTGSLGYMSRPEGMEPSICPECGAQIEAGVGCSLCPGGSRKGAASAYAGAESAWSTAEDHQREAEAAHDAAVQRLAEADANWTRAQAAHTAAIEAGANADRAWDEAQRQGEQASVDWEVAQTRWKRAQEAHGDEDDDEPASETVPGAAR